MAEMSEETQKLKLELKKEQLLAVENLSRIKEKLLEMGPSDSDNDESSKNSIKLKTKQTKPKSNKWYNVALTETDTSSSEYEECEQETEVTDGESDAEERLWKISTTQAQFIPSFRADVNDPNETARFLESFKSIAKNSRWPPSIAKAIFESKLEGKAKTRYMETIGMEKKTPLDKILIKFKKLFTKSLKREDREDLFQECRQKGDETVINFSYRLESLASGLVKLKKGGLKQRNHLLNRQFMKGLKDEIAVPVMQDASKNYEKNVIKAEKVEKSLARLEKRKLVRVNASTTQKPLSPDAEIDKLKKRINELELKLSNANKASRVVTGRENPISSQNSGGKYYCTICNKGNHSDQYCYVRDPNLKLCMSCKGSGHFYQQCPLQYNTTAQSPPQPWCDQCKQNGHDTTTCQRAAGQATNRNGSGN